MPEGKEIYKTQNVSLPKRPLIQAKKRRVLREMAEREARGTAATIGSRGRTSEFKGSAGGSKGEHRTRYQSGTSERAAAKTSSGFTEKATSSRKLPLVNSKKKKALKIIKGEASGKSGQFVQEQTIKLRPR